MKDLITWANSPFLGGQFYFILEFLEYFVKILKSWRTARIDRDKVTGRGPTRTDIEKVSDRVTLSHAIVFKYVKLCTLSRMLLLN